MGAMVPSFNGMKSRRNPVFAIILASVIIHCPVVAQMPGYFPNPGYDSKAQDVSMVQLIATPQQHDGKRVRFVGFLRIEFEGDAVYLHREDYEKGITRDALWITIPSEMTKRQQEAVNTQYVICVGVFDASHRGHMDLFSGAIKNVARLQLWPSGSTK
jgi:hypothetical protein